MVISLEGGEEWTNLDKDSLFYDMFLISPILLHYTFMKLADCYLFLYYLAVLDFGLNPLRIPECTLL